MGNSELWDWIKKYNELSCKYGTQRAKNKDLKKQLLLYEQEVEELECKNDELEKRCRELQRSSSPRKMPRYSYTENNTDLEDIYIENSDDNFNSDEYYKVKCPINKKLTGQQQKVNVEELQKQIEALAKEVRSIQEFI